MRAPRTWSQQRLLLAGLTVVVILNGVLLALLARRTPQPADTPAPPQGQAPLPAPPFTRVSLPVGPVALPLHKTTGPVAEYRPFREYPLGELLNLAVDLPYVYAVGGTTHLGVFRVDIPKGSEEPLQVSALSALDPIGRAYRCTLGPRRTLITSNEVAGLTVIDVADPYRPRVASRLAEKGTTFWGLEAREDLLVAAASPASLRLYDLADPARPRSVARLTEGLEDPRDVALTDSLAVVADGPGGLKVVDLSRPETPRLVGRVPTTEPAERVVVHGSLAFCGMGADGLDVVDLSRPETPRRLSHFRSDVPVFGLAAAGDRLYVAGWSHLLVLDISDPGRPAEVGRVQPRRADHHAPLLMDVAAAGEDLVVAAEWSNLRFFRPRPSGAAPGTETAGLSQTSLARIRAPEFELPVLRGSDAPSLSLQSLRGHPVVLAFFSPY